MSYVAITDKLKHNIDACMLALEGAEHRDNRPPTPITLDATEPWLVNKMWGPLAGTPFLRHPELTVHGTISLSIAVTMTDTSSPISGNRSDVSVFCMQCSNTPRYLKVDVDGDRSYATTIEAVPEDHPHLAELVAHELVAKEIKARWQANRKQVKEFLSACKSLNEALKLWPDLQRYVSPSDLQRISEKAEKPVKDQSAAIARLAAMDMERIQVSNVLARLAGANVTRVET